MAAPMIDLEIIKIVSQCSEQYLTFLLSQCLNVREIFLGMQTSISDRVWADVLAKNSLSHLEKITIQKCSKVLELQQLDKPPGITLKIFLGYHTWHRNLVS